MKRLEHTINGERVVHYDGPQHAAGYTLCGHDTTGDALGHDRSEQWTEAVETRRRVTCPHCLAIVAHVRGRSNAGRTCDAPKETP